MRIYVTMSLLISLSACNITNIKKTNIDGLIELCRGSITTERANKIYAGFNKSKDSLEVGIDVKHSKEINTVDGMSDKFDKDKVEIFHECIDKRINEIKSSGATSSVDILSGVMVIAEGHPRARKDKSWFFDWHSNDWIIDYNTSVKNLGTENVRCRYYISSCKQDSANCENSYKGKNEEFDLAKNSGTFIQGNFKIEYEKKTPPVKASLDCFAKK